MLDFLKRRYTQKRMRIVALVFLFVALTPGFGGIEAFAEENAPDAGAQGCVSQVYRGADFVVCRVDPARGDIRLFLKNETGEYLSHFARVNEMLAARGERLAFAMNAGMYHDSRAPVGLYVEQGQEVTPLNTNDGPGNFHMKPNGVFWLAAEDDRAVAHVASAEKYQTAATESVVRYATQSGPMLVIDGKVHLRFLPDSDSFKRRNGVGVTEEGEVIFVLADAPVRFYDFAIYFRDELKTPNALYLDGTISRLYAPELERNDPGAAMGPIIGVVVAADEKEGT